MNLVQYYLIIMFSFIIISCSNTEQNPPIKLPAEVKGCLISTELFDEEWSWEDSDLSIKQSEPNASNQFESSVVVTQIDRLTKDGIHRFDFATGLVTYEKPITFGFNLEDNAYDSVELHPDFSPINGRMKYFCGVTVSNGKRYDYGCQIQIIYTYHVFNMTHWGNTFVDIKTLEDFLNPLLVQFDSCISNLEK